MAPLCPCSKMMKTLFRKVPVFLQQTQCPTSAHHTFRPKKIFFNQTNSHLKRLSSMTVMQSEFTNSGNVTVSSKTKASILQGNTDRYHGVHIDLRENSWCAEEFRTVLKASMDFWLSDGKSAVWLKIPIEQSDFITIAHTYGFQFHHAEGSSSMLCRWMRTDQTSLLPQFATHQVGVAGCVLNEDSREVLVVRDRNKPFTLWKFPGGMAELGEDIGKTAEREVFEETGLKTEFQGILTFRQQHNQPGAYGRSDLFFVCHMRPLTFDLNPCAEEIEECEWMKLDKLEETMQTSAITIRCIMLLQAGLRFGFGEVEMPAEEFKSVYKGVRFNVYNTQSSKFTQANKRSSSQSYVHSVIDDKSAY